MLDKRRSIIFGMFFCILIAVTICFGTTAIAAETDTTGSVADAESTVNAVDSDLVLKAYSGWFDSTVAGIEKKEITKIIFSDSVPTGYTASWDASATGNGGVMAYLVGTEVTIVGNGTGKVYANSNSRSMFHGLEKLVEIENIGMLDTGNVTTMKYMFYNCKSLEELDVSGFDTRNVTDMYCMFFYCAKVTELDVSGLDTGNVTDMAYMFYNCEGLEELNLSGFDTGSVTNMHWMFANCHSLKELTVDGFDTRNVTDMNGMFSSCWYLTKLDLSDFDTGNVTDMASMFGVCTRLSELDISNFDTGNVTNMRFMFGSCDSLKFILAGEGFIIPTPSDSEKESTFYSGKNLFGGNGKKYTYLNWENAKLEAVCDCHETPGLFTYNGTDKCVVTYDLNYEGASAVDFTQQVKQGKSITVGGAAGQVPDPERMNYEFLGWGTSPNSAAVYQAGDGVPANSANITLYAQWKVLRCTITIDWQDGETPQTPIDYDSERTLENITVPARDGYNFRGIYSEPNGLGKLYVNIDGTWYRDWDGKGDATLYAFWSRADCVDYFWDVQDTDWFYDDVYFMYDRGLMLGMGNSTTFGPYLELTRSQFVTILYRMAHSPEKVVYEDRFPDVAEGKWYSTPVMWAYKTRIVTGYDSGYFGPNDSITREQMAVMLYRYVSWKGGFDITARADLSGFEDADRVSSWAYDAVSWAVAEGVIRGKKNGTLIDPQGVTARCECSAMVQRYCDAAK